MKSLVQALRSLLSLYGLAERGPRRRRVDAVYIGRPELRA